jgi:hypothetical protein
MKVGVTGTREGMTLHQKEQFVLKLFELKVTEFHHGDCEGADAEAHDIVREFFPDVRIVVHPPSLTKTQAFRKGDEHRKPLPYIVRDKNIVDETEFLIGAPLSDTEVWRSGTWTTIRHARKTGKPHEVLKR